MLRISVRSFAGEYAALPLLVYPKWHATSSRQYGDSRRVIYCDPYKCHGGLWKSLGVEGLSPYCHSKQPLVWGRCSDGACNLSLVGLLKFVPAQQSTSLRPARCLVAGRRCNRAACPGNSFLPVVEEIPPQCCGGANSLFTSPTRVQNIRDCSLQLNRWYR